MGNDPFDQLYDVMSRTTWLYTTVAIDVGARMISTVITMCSYSRMVYYLRTRNVGIRRATRGHDSEGAATRTVVIITVLHLLLITLPKIAYAIYWVQYYINDVKADANVHFFTDKTVLITLGFASPDTVLYLVFNARFRLRFLELFCGCVVGRTIRRPSRSEKGQTRAQGDEQQAIATNRDTVRSVIAQLQSGDSDVVVTRAVGATDCILEVDHDLAPKETNTRYRRNSTEGIETFV